jgi:hypothetical protein
MNHQGLRYAGVGGEQINVDPGSIAAYFRGRSANPPNSFRGCLERIIEVCSISPELQENIDVEELRDSLRRGERYGLAQKSPQQEPTPLTADEISSVWIYTTDSAEEGKAFFNALNFALRTRTGLREFSDYVWLLMNALSKMPMLADAPRKVFRGVKVNLFTEYSRRPSVMWHMFSSCSDQLRVQNNFLGPDGPRTLFVIELTTWRGRNISRYSSQPQENELLLPPCTSFTVEGCIDGGNGLCIVSLREEAPHPDDMILEYGLEQVSGCVCCCLPSSECMMFVCLFVWFVCVCRWWKIRSEDCQNYDSNYHK